MAAVTPALCKIASAIENNYYYPLLSILCPVHQGKALFLDNSDKIPKLAWFRHKLTT